MVYVNKCCWFFFRVQSHIWRITIAQKYICTSFSQGVSPASGSSPQRQRSLVVALKSAVRHTWNVLALGKPFSYCDEEALSARTDFTRSKSVKNLAVTLAAATFGECKASRWVPVCLCFSWRSMLNNLVADIQIQG